MSVLVCKIFLTYLTSLKVPLQQGDQPVNPKGNQPWIFIESTDAEAEAPDVKSWLIGHTEPLDWTGNLQRVFCQIKTALISAPVLGTPNLNKPFIYLRKQSLPWKFAPKKWGQFHNQGHISPRNWAQWPQDDQAVWEPGIVRYNQRKQEWAETIKGWVFGSPISRFHSHYISHPSL